MDEIDIEQAAEPARQEEQGYVKPSPSAVRPGINEMIGRRLRGHYEELQQQPLPDRLANLLDALERIDEAVPPPRRN